MTIVNREAPWFVWMEGWTATGERIKKSVSRRKWENPTSFFRPFGFQFFAPPSTKHIANLLFLLLVQCSNQECYWTLSNNTLGLQYTRCRVLAFNHYHWPSVDRHVGVKQARRCDSNLQSETMND